MGHRAVNTGDREPLKLPVTRSKAAEGVGHRALNTGDREKLPVTTTGLEVVWVTVL